MKPRPCGKREYLSASFVRHLLHTGNSRNPALIHGCGDEENVFLRKSRDPGWHPGCSLHRRRVNHPDCRPGVPLGQPDSPHTTCLCGCRERLSRPPCLAFSSCCAFRRHRLVLNTTRRSHGSESAALATHSPGPCNRTRCVHTFATRDGLAARHETIGRRRMAPALLLRRTTHRSGVPLGQPARLTSCLMGAGSVLRGLPVLPPPPHSRCALRRGGL